MQGYMMHGNYIPVYVQMQYKHDRLRKSSIILLNLKLKMAGKWRGNGDRIHRIVIRAGVATGEEGARAIL